MTARSIAQLARQDLPFELALESSLPDLMTDRRLAQPDPHWLRGLPDFVHEGEIDFGEYQEDLIQSVSGLSR